MVHATFLIKRQYQQYQQYTTTSGYFENKSEAGLKAHAIAQCKDHVSVICFIDGDSTESEFYHNEPL